MASSYAFRFKDSGKRASSPRKEFELLYNRPFTTLWQRDERVYRSKVCHRPGSRVYDDSNFLSFLCPFGPLSSLEVLKQLAHFLSASFWYICYRQEVSGMNVMHIRDMVTSLMGDL